jgi:hypothetical protein
MKSIPEVPASVIFECATNPEIFWAWVSEQHYAQMLEQAGDEWLVRIRQRFQLEAVAAVCQAYHQYAGQRGQAATYWPMLARKAALPCCATPVAGCWITGNKSMRSTTPRCGFCSTRKPSLAARANTRNIGWKKVSAMRWKHARP